jgi:hypothetical protein
LSPTQDPSQPAHPEFGKTVAAISFAAGVLGIYAAIRQGHQWTDSDAESSRMKRRAAGGHCDCDRDAVVAGGWSLSITQAFFSSLAPSPLCVPPPLASLLIGGVAVHPLGL